MRKPARQAGNPQAHVGSRRLYGRSDWLYVLCGVVTAVCWLSPFGCANSRGTKPPQNDPLLGGAPPVQPGAVPPVAPSAIPAAPARSTTPPRSTTSNAALAPGGPRYLDSERDLRLGDAPGWSGQPVSLPDGRGAVLRPPETGMGQPASRDVMQTPQIGLVGGVRPIGLTYEQLQARLAACGILWQKLEQNSETGEWQFSVAVPNRQNPNLRRIHRATAATDVAAMQAVLQEIERGN